jgi:hypothetical protein
MLVMLMLRGSIHTITRNKEVLLFTSKKNGLEVNAEKTEYMVMSPEENAGRNHNVKVGNKSFKSMEQFKYSETLLRKV